MVVNITEVDLYKLLKDWNDWSEYILSSKYYSQEYSIIHG